MSGHNTVNAALPQHPKLAVV